MTAKLSFELVTDIARFDMLEAEWGDLWQRADRPLFSQSFAWCRAGWETTGTVRRRRLYIVIMREAGRAVVIWPMTLRRRLDYTEALPLGSESREYDSILVEAGPDARRRVQAAWAFVRQSRQADVVVVPFVRGGTATEAVFAERKQPRANHSMSSPYVDFSETESWDDYWRSRSKSLRSNVSRGKRRLEQLGAVTFNLVDAEPELAALLEWTLTQKQDWMKRTHQRKTDYLEKPEFRDFLLALAQRRSAATGHLAVAVLKVGGKPVATGIGSIDDTRFELLIITYHPAFATGSPGQVLLMDALKWCHARNLQFDFRLGGMWYKSLWSTGDCPATMFRLETTTRGRLAIGAGELLERGRETKDWVRTRIPDTWRHWIKHTFRDALRIVRGDGPMADYQKPA